VEQGEAVTEDEASDGTLEDEGLGEERGEDGAYARNFVAEEGSSDVTLDLNRRGFAFLQLRSFGCNFSSEERAPEDRLEGNNRIEAAPQCRFPSLEQSPHKETPHLRLHLDKFICSPIHGRPSPSKRISQKLPPNARLQRNENLLRASQFPTLLPNRSSHQNSPGRSLYLPSV
jgi:hypothetical protein